MSIFTVLDENKLAFKLGLEIFFNNRNQFKMKNLGELSPTKQSWQVAEFKISYHNKSKASDYPKINDSKDAEL